MKEEKDILKEHIISGFKQEVPTIDFTEKIMSKIENSIATKPVVAPLISKKYWLITIAVGIVLILISFGIEIQDYDLDWFTDLGFKLPDFEKFKSTIYISFVVCTVLGLMTIADLVYRKKNQSI